MRRYYKQVQATAWQIDSRQPVRTDSRDHDPLRSTALAYYLFIYLVSLIMQVCFAGTNKEIWLSSLIALPALFAGILLGQLLFKKISQRVFQVLTYVILLFTGLYLLTTSL
ncbi:sulfite exporter TauE/SafE family protein [uncultured Brevibacillus sp.]|uniref:sulfite exporter TauE/SafE family protein n=1 Tax=uncultured Brevibacillus sp. TaxID=169970 RepID=UPI002599147B|nr:sulfite exporter TauE/SafE family protein [uncultured Brevibacillus sp.]